MLRSIRWHLLGVLLAGSAFMVLGILTPALMHRHALAFAGVDRDLTLPAARVAWRLPTSVAGPTVAGAADSVAPSTAARLPAHAIASLTIRNGRAEMRHLANRVREGGYGPSAAGQLINANRDLTQGRVALAGLAGAVGVEQPDVLGLLMGTEMTLALLPNENPEGEPILAGVSRVDDPDRVRQLLTVVGRFAGAERVPELEQAVAGSSAEVIRLGAGTGARGAGGSANRPPLLYTLRDRELIFANDVEVMRSILAPGPEWQSLADDAAFQEAMVAAPANAVLVGQLRAGAWSADGNAGAALLFPERAPNALGGMLFSGWQRALTSAERIVMWANLGGSAGPGGDDDAGEVTPLMLQIGGRIEPGASLPDEFEGFFAAVEDDAGEASGLSDVDSVESGVISNAVAPRPLLHLRVERDWAALFTARERYLTPTAAGQLVEFANGLSTLMGGIDFIDDVLGRIEGPIEVVAAPQTFGTIQPTPMLPAFALAARMPGVAESDPAFAARLESAALSGLAVTNIDGAQKGRPALLLGMEDLEGHRVIYGRYPAPQPMDGGPAPAPSSDPAPTAVGPEYNFEPCIALAGDRLLIATSLDLMRNLLSAPAGPPDVVDRAAGDRLGMDVGGVVSELRRNEDQLIANRMIERNISRAAALRDVRRILAALDLIDTIELTTIQRAPTGRLDFTLTVTAEARTGPDQQRDQDAPEGAESRHGDGSGDVSSSASLRSTGEQGS